MCTLVTLIAEVPRENERPVMRIDPIFNFFFIIINQDKNKKEDLTWLHHASINLNARHINDLVGMVNSINMLI